MNSDKIIQIASDIAENEVERRIGDWLAIQVDSNGDESYSEEAQDLFNECYDEALTILNRHL